MNEDRNGHDNDSSGMSDHEGIKLDAKKEFETPKEKEGYRSSLTEPIITGRMSVTDYLKNSPETPVPYGLGEQDFEEANNAIEEARKALEEGKVIIRKKGLVSLIENMRSGWKRMNEEEEVIEPPLYADLAEKSKALETAVKTAVPVIRKGEHTIEKIKEYRVSLKVEYHKWLPFARDLEDSVSKLDREIVKLQYDAEHFEGSTAEKTALDVSLGEMKAEKERMKHEEALIFEKIESLTNRSAMAQQDLEQTTYLIRMLERYVQSAEHYIQEAAVKKDTKPDVSVIGPVTENTRAAISAVQAALHNVREKERIIAKTTAKTMMEQGLPTEIYGQEELKSSQDTTDYIKKAFDEQNRKSISKGLVDISGVH